MRLPLATLLAERGRTRSATLEALSNTNLPAGQLSLPPRTVAPTCLQAAMHALAAAGEQLALSPTTVGHAVGGYQRQPNLKSEPRSRKKAMARPSVRFLTTTNARATVLDPCWSMCRELSYTCPPWRNPSRTRMHAHCKETVDTRGRRWKYETTDKRLVPR